MGCISITARRFARSIARAGLIALFLPKFLYASVVFDLTSQWVDGSNPFGTWSFYYTNPANNYQLVAPISPTVRSSDPWGTPQQSYGDLPGFFKSNGTEQFAHDWIAGDVITHTDFTQPVAVVWTAPFATQFSVTIDVWSARQIGRSSHGTIVIENEFDQNVFGIDPVAFGPDSTNAATYTFSSPGVMQAGSQVIFGFRSDTGFGDYQGLRFTVVTDDPTVIPEPSTLCLTLIGYALLAWFCSQRRERRGWNTAVEFREGRHH